MNRKTFIESQGATCDNWQWSWSFVNEQARFVIFGVWDYEEDQGGKILDRAWERGEDGRKNKGYGQSLRHIRLVTESGYKLLTFPQIPKQDEGEKGFSPKVRVSIEKIIPVLERRFVFEAEGAWYSALAPMPPADSYKTLVAQTFEEGEKVPVMALRAERNRKARQACLAHHGYACNVCGCTMSDIYGSVGKDVIEVHHLHEMALCDGARPVDPRTDLVPVCPNCHAVLHKKCPAYAPEEVRLMLRRSLESPFQHS